MKKFKNIAVFCIQQIILTCDNRIVKLKGVIKKGVKSAFNAWIILNSRKNSIVTEIREKLFEIEFTIHLITRYYKI